MPLIILGVWAPRVAAQRLGYRNFDVHSCAAADSIFGPRRHGGMVSVSHDPDSTTFTIRAYAASRLLPTLVRAGNQPAPWPTPGLILAIEGATGRRILAERARHPIVQLLIDDTTRVMLGEGLVGNYSGAASSTLAPLGVNLAPTDALQIARAVKLAVIVDSSVQRIPGEDLRAFAAFYTFAICDTLPYH